jgi:group I intron endonuclease
MIVYKATNKINNKVYIGYTTKTLNQRKKEHLYKSNCKSDKHYFYLFRQAIRKYGFDSFDWEILSTHKTIEECCKSEIYFIKTFNSVSPNGYNLTDGGNGGIQSEEIKNKISKSVKKFWDNNEEKHPWFNVDKNTRSEWAKKSWKTKKEKKYKPKSFTHSSESKQQMSETKNLNNRVIWLNENTGEEKFLSCTEMSIFTGLSTSTFNHLKKGRSIKTKCGWIIKQK